MPIPKPTTGENESDFMGRCMADDAMQEYDQDQRVAVCSTAWSDRGKMYRGYSLFNIKKIDSEERVIEGIASTPTPDRMNDIVEVDGIKFNLPLPLLYQHNPGMPIGHIVSAKKTKDGLLIKAKIAAAGVAEFIDQAWNLIKARLVQGLSIGFRSLEDSYMSDTGGIHFLRTELFEISAVTIPANAEATILNVKSAVSQLQAASGHGQQRDINVNRPGVSGITKAKKMTVKEQISQFEAKRAANAARMTELMNKSAEDGRTLTTEETEEYDGLESEVEQIDGHLKRLRTHEKQLAATAVPATTETTATTQTAAASRNNSQVVTVQSRLPKGIEVARMAIALYNARGNKHMAIELAHKYFADTPGVELMLKTAVEAADTTTSGWASQLVPAAGNPQGDFLELLRPATILGRIPGLRNVPFNIAVPVQTAGGTYQWVGEAAAKPVTSATFSSVTLRWAKAAGIIVITKELAKFSSPDAQVIIRDEMIAGIARFLDTQFVGTAAEVTNVSPAGILNGISATPATGTTANYFRVDMNNVLNNFAANNVDPTGLVILMSATSAIALSLMVNTFGQAEFPNLTVNGGTILGLPVVVSENVGNKIIVLNARDIFLAQDSGIAVDISDQASVEMDTEPVIGDTSPITGAVLKSLWQNNLIGLRVERYITWKKGRTAAAEYISGVAYAPTVP